MPCQTYNFQITAKTIWHGIYTVLGNVLIMNTNIIPYKYWYLEYSSFAKDNLFYCRCMNYITKETYRSLKHSPDKEIENFLRNKINYSHHYRVVKSESLNQLLYNCMYQIGDVLLLNGNGSGDADYFLMKERIISIAERCLQGARENKNIILNYLRHGLSHGSYSRKYDSVNVRDEALSLLRSFR